MSQRDDRNSFADVESRRSPYSSRRLSFGRRLYYLLGMPIAYGLLLLLWRSYRVQAVIGSDIAERLIAGGTLCGPCFWHQNIVPCVYLMRQWLKRGFHGVFTISASVDGDVPTKIATRWGADVIRGSANTTGALVLRDLHAAMKHGGCVISFADGPTGPRGRFKSGVVLVAKVGSMPLLPIGCAADRAWYLDRWDHFMIPKPFAKIVLAIGEPVPVPRSASPAEMERIREMMENAVNSLVEQSNKQLET